MHSTAFVSLLRRFALVAPVALLFAVPNAGCTRKFFRKRTDNDVTGILTQKNVFPEWQVRNWHVYPDPRARYADQSNPDRPPYPPDDFAARLLSPNPQAPRKKYGTGRMEGTGYLDYLAQWDAQNRAGDPPGGQPGDPKQFLAPPAEKLPAPKSVPPGTATRPPENAPNPVRLAGATVALPAIPQLPAPKLPAPTITESRESGVIVAAGEIRDGDKTIPAVVVIPSVQPPELPTVQGSAKGQNPPQKNTDPGPFPAGPGIPPGGPAVPGKEDTLGLFAAGDAALNILQALETNQKGYRIRMEQAVELGLLNSREFQDRREDLYNAALPVTLARFSFAAQGFFTETAVVDWAGRFMGVTPRNRFNPSTGMGFSKLFPTGALLMVKLANSVVVDLSNSQPTTTLSNFSINLAQPFLQGGGYAVTLEPLTQTERTLLYAIRSYARFRKLFYVAISAGGNITNNPYGLQGLAVNLGRGVGNNLTAPSVGFLPILLQTAVIANQRRNVESLEQLLLLYQAFREGGQQSDLQVMQVEQQLINGRTTLLGSSNVTGAGGGGANPNAGIRGYLDALDNYKLQLGLPLTVGLDLDATPLKPIRDQLGRFEDVYAQIRDLEALARRYDPAEPVNQFRPRLRKLLTDSDLTRGTPFSRDIQTRWSLWERATVDQLTKRLADLAEERRKILDRKADRQLKNQPEPAAETRRLNEIEADIDLGVFEQAVRLYESQPWQRDTGKARATIQAAAFRDVFNAFFQLILEARNDRLARIRTQWPKLPPILVEGHDLLDVPLDDAYTTVIQTALTHRLDLMNTRGGVVDAWRQVKVTANALQGVLTVGYNLSSNTPAGGANPVAYSGSLTDQRIIIQTELPLVRRAERNNYRFALIGYQRARRALMAFEDNIANDVRSDIRELRTIAQLYRVQQRLIELGYAQIDNAQAVLLAPPPPAGPGQSGQNDAGTQAALTQQVLNAQQSLVTAQNQLYTIWINYLVSRMTLYLDLEHMQLDERGEWCNEPHQEADLPGPNPPRPEPSRPAGERLPAPRTVVAPGSGSSKP